MKRSPLFGLRLEVRSAAVALALAAVAGCANPSPDEQPTAVAPVIAAGAPTAPEGAAAPGVVADALEAQQPLHRLRSAPPRLRVRHRHATPR
jgi:hypothetical protein